MSELAEKIRSEIEAKGIISFARFMEMALYAPGLGYYERAPQRLGRGGDFYTSVSVGPLFGELMAFQFAEWLEAGPRGKCQLVEAGAHGAQLAHDILAHLRQSRPQFLERVEYYIVEPSAARQQWQRETLAAFADQVRWVDSLAALPAVHGVFFSNELLDAFPVHRVGWDASAQRWFEWGVSWKTERFFWARMEEAEAKAVRNETLQIPRELRALLPDHFTTEICPAAARWWKAAADKLERGRLLTIDYGLAAEEFYAPQRAAGTLRAYARHRICEDPLANPGEQDLTSSVNFTVLQMMGELAGLTTAPLTAQHRFLTDIFARTLPAGNRFPEWTPARTRQFQTLTHPEHLGRPFRVLVQSR
jgi:SAM-dependent MidA family methyltransferase